MDLRRCLKIVLTEPGPTEVLNWDGNNGENTNSQS